MAKAVTKKPIKRTIKTSELISANKRDSSRVKEQLARIKKNQPLISELEQEQFIETEVNNKIEAEIQATIEPEFKEAERVPEIVNEDLSLTIGDQIPFEAVPAQSNVSAEPVLDKAEPIISESLKQKISLFDDMAKGTEQDVQQINKLEDLADDFLDSSFAGDSIEDSIEVRKTNAKISAGVWVTVIDVAMMLGCLFLSNDFSDDSQRKFSLIPERKNAIKHSIYQILMLRKKKSNPYYSLSLAILGSYAPMFVIAFLSGRKKKQDSITANQNRAAAMASQAMATNSNPVAPNQNMYTPYRSNADVVENFGGKIHPQKSRNLGGRHKKGCDHYLDKPCNCRRPDFKRPEWAKS
jgi:hypothetical protein